MSVKGEQNIIKLQITVDDAVRVEVLQSKKDLRRVKLGLTKRELFALDVQHEVTSTNVLHDKVHARLSLETRVQAK